MTVIAFPGKSATPFEPYRLKVTLRKNGHRWFYEIKPLGEKCQTWVRIDGKPHRVQMVYDPRQVRLLHEQYQREIAILERDGWQRT